MTELDKFLKYADIDDFDTLLAIIRELKAACENISPESFINAIDVEEMQKLLFLKGETAREALTRCEAIAKGEE